MVQRYRPSPALMLQQLIYPHYKRSDADGKRDLLAFLHEILQLTSHDDRPEAERTTITYRHFQSHLRMNLNAPHGAHWYTEIH